MNISGLSVDDFLRLAPTIVRPMLLGILRENRIILGCVLPDVLEVSVVDTTWRGEVIGVASSPPVLVVIWRLVDGTLPSHLSAFQLNCIAVTDGESLDAKLDGLRLEFQARLVRIL